jgi:tetratricopeptide (TPR) repeat protein
VLGQAAVDWLWLIPGVMGLAFLTLGTGLAMLRPDDRRLEPERQPRLLRISVGAAMIALVVIVSSVYLGDVYERKARAAGADAQARLDAARTAARLTPWATAPLYLQAGALEDLGRRPAARRRLLEALDLEPRNFVTLALLGDLEERAGKRRAARDWYLRALAVNPRDVGLRKLAGAGP